MAKVIGPIHSDFAAGSLGSTVFKRNQYGFYSYEKPVYVDAPTANQTAWRAVIASLWTIWKNDAYFSAAKRAQWQEFSRQFSSSTRYGREIFASPAQWFIKLNCHKQANGLTLFDSPPRDPGCNYFPTFEFTQDSSGLWLTTDPTPDANQLVSLAWVPYQSTIRNFCPKSQVPLGYVLQASDDPLLIVSNDDLLPTENRYFFMLRSIDTYGRLSPRQYFTLDLTQSWIPTNPYVFTGGSWIWDNSPDTNYSADTELNIRYSGGVGNNRRSLIYRDFSEIPPGTVFSSAILNLYCTQLPAESKTVFCYPIVLEWIHSECTWNDRFAVHPWFVPGLGAGLDYSTSMYDSVLVDTALTWYQFDITDIVNAWSGGSDNWGLFLKQNSGYNTDSMFAGCNYADASKRPYVDLTL